MSYDLFLIRDDPSRTVDDDLTEELIEEAGPDDRAFTENAQQSLDDLLREMYPAAPKDERDVPQIFVEEGLIHIALTYTGSGRHRVEDLMRFLAAASARLNAVVFDPQLERVIDPSAANSEIAGMFQSGRNALDALGIDPNSGGRKSKRRPWWRFWASE